MLNARNQKRAHPLYRNVYPNIRTAMTAKMKVNITIINIKDLPSGLLRPPIASLRGVVDATGPADVAIATAVVRTDVMAALVTELDVVLEEPLFLLLVPEEAFPALTARLPNWKPTFAMTAWLSRTVTDALPSFPIVAVWMVESAVVGVPSLDDSKEMPFQVVPVVESPPAAVRVERYSVSPLALGNERLNVTLPLLVTAALEVMELMSTTADNSLFV